MRRSRRTGDSLFMRFAAAVGDLHSPFYEEERQRDVWNEASAVGFQLVLWLGLVAANLMVWLGGSTGVPYALGVFGLVIVASLVVIAYAARLGIELELREPTHWRSWTAMLPLVVLMGAFFAGLALRWDRTEGAFGGLRDGLVFGGITAAVALAVLTVWQQLRARKGRDRRVGRGSRPAG